MCIHLCTKIIVLYKLSHVISKDLDGGATEADGRASAPVGPSVAMPLPAALLQNEYSTVIVYSSNLVSIRPVGRVNM